MHRVTIVGLGLMGGSLGAALLKYTQDVEVVGVAKSEDTLRKAIERNVVHWGTVELSKAVEGASIVFVATPIESIPHVVKDVANLTENELLITDMGSTKEFIYKELKRSPLPENIQYVGGHPIAGSEKSGMENADEELYRGKVYILMPHKLSKKASLLHHLLESIGSKILIMEPSQHDALLALLSHLPHLIAFSLVLELKDKYGIPPLLPQSFQDLTRIAASNSSLWTQIFLTNRDKIHHYVKEICNQLQGFDELLVSSPSKVEELIAMAKHFKEQLNGTI